MKPEVKRIGSSVVSVALVLGLVTTAYAATYKTLGVPNKTQEKSNWCWAASSTSILGWYGKSVTQSAFATTVKGSTVNDTATDSEAKSGLSAYGLSSSYTSDYVSFSTLVTQIDNNRPLYAGWSWTSGGGHAVVIDGYDQSSEDLTVKYMDPGYGSKYWILYSDLKGGYSSADHTWDGTIYNFSKNSNW